MVLLSSQQPLSSENAFLLHAYGSLVAAMNELYNPIFQASVLSKLSQSDAFSWDFGIGTER